MEIRMTKISSGPDGCFHPGDKRTVTTEEGRALVAAGAAEDITPAVAGMRGEHADIEAHERAVMHGKRGRGRPASRPE